MPLRNVGTRVTQGIKRLRLRTLWAVLRVWHKLALMSKLHTYKQATAHCHNLCRVLIREEFQLPLGTNDPEVDRDVAVAASTYLAGAPTCEDPGGAKYYNWLRRDATARECRRGYRDIQEWTRQSPLDEAIGGASNITQSEATKLTKEMKRKFKHHNRRFRESKAHKIDAAEIANDPRIRVPTLWLATTGIAFSGMIYTHGYFGEFGINATTYFTIPDYIQYSLKQGWPAMWGTVAYIYGLLDGHVRRTTRTDETLRFERRWAVGPVITLLVIAGVAIPVLWLLGYPELAQRLQQPLVYPLMGAVVVHKVIPYYFTNSEVLKNVLATAVLFFGLVWTSAKADAYRMANKPTGETVIRTQTTVYSKAEYKVIAENSGYVFMMDRQQRIEIIPRQTILTVALENATD